MARSRSASYDQFEFKGAVSGPLTKTLSRSASPFIRSKRDGFVKDVMLDRDYNDKDTVGVRGALAFTPSDRLRVDITADYSQDDASLTVGQPLNDLKSLFLLPLPITNYLYEDGYHFKATTTPGLPNSTKLKHRGCCGNDRLRPDGRVDVEVDHGLPQARHARLHRHRRERARSWRRLRRRRPEAVQRGNAARL